MGKLWRMYRKFCLDSTVIGLKYFYLYPDRVSRCFWALCLALSGCWALLVAAQLYARFTAMPTRVTIESQNAPLADLPWPAITVCSPKQISESHAKHFVRTLIDGNMSASAAELLPQMLGFMEMVNAADERALREFQDMLQLNRYTVMDVLTSIPQSCEEFIKRCFFRDAPTDCGKLLAPIFTPHGLCCVFNSPYRLDEKKKWNDRVQNFTPHMASSNDMDQSLVLVVDLEPEDAVDLTLVNAGGIMMMFHDHTELPSDDETCLVPARASVYTFLAGVRIYCSDEVRGLPIESRRCVFPHERSNGGLTWAGGYHNSDCDLLCLVRAVRARCRCELFYGVERRRPCDFTHIPCIMDVKWNLSNITEVTECECPRDCDARQYRADCVVGNLDALPYMINPYGDSGAITDTASVLHFTFDSDFYVVQKQETVMSLINLMSNLGGAFGLFLGVSVFSVLELLFFLYRAAAVLAARARRRLRPRANPPPVATVVVRSRQ